MRWQRPTFHRTNSCPGHSTPDLSRATRPLSHISRCFFPPATRQRPASSCWRGRFFLARPSRRNRDSVRALPCAPCSPTQSSPSTTRPETPQLVTRALQRLLRQLVAAPLKAPRNGGRLPGQQANFQGKWACEAMVECGEGRQTRRLLFSGTNDPPLSCLAEPELLI